MDRTPVRGWRIDVLTELKRIHTPLTPSSLSAPRGNPQLPLVWSVEPRKRPEHGESSLESALAARSEAISRREH